MYIYIFSVLFASLFGYLTSIAHSKWGKAAFATIAVVPFCIFAGCRSLTVGADTSTYPIQSLYYALSMDLPSTISGLQTEWLYSICVWLISRVSNEVWIQLLFLQLITVVPLVVGLLNVAPKHVGLGLAVYGLVMYCWSMNIIRQTAAASILIIAYLYAKDKKIGSVTTNG